MITRDRRMPERGEIGGARDRRAARDALPLHVRFSRADDPARLPAAARAAGRIPARRARRDGGGLRPRADLSGRAGADGLCGGGHRGGDHRPARRGGARGARPRRDRSCRRCAGLRAPSRLPGRASGREPGNPATAAQAGLHPGPPLRGARNDGVIAAARRSG